jgi:HAD superfamily hydrolase (TIGR01509 family)
VTAPPFVLLDLYDTLAHADLERIRAGRAAIAARLGVSAGTLAAAYESTAAARSRGQFGGAAGDMAAILEAAGVQADERLRDEVVEIEIRLWLEGVLLYPDVDACLDGLRARGQRLALVSNCGFQTRPLVDAWGLDRRLDVIVLSYEVRLAKPDPAIYRLALHRLGGEPANALLVDDQVAFLDAAAALGMATYRVQRKEEVFPPHPDPPPRPGVPAKSRWRGADFAGWVAPTLQYRW